MEVRSIVDVGAAVKAARSDLKLTQEQAAALCGVSMPFMNQLEGGKRLHLSVTKVLGVCLTLGLTVSISGPGQRRAEVAPSKRAG